MKKEVSRKLIFTYMPFTWKNNKRVAGTPQEVQMSMPDGIPQYESVTGEYIGNMYYESSTKMTGDEEFSELLDKLNHAMSNLVVGHSGYDTEWFHIVEVKTIR